jgi:hypothetical protein
VVDAGSHHDEEVFNRYQCVFRNIDQHLRRPGAVAGLSGLPGMEHAVTALHPGAGPLVAVEQVDAQKNLCHLNRLKAIERIALRLNPLGHGLLELRLGSARGDLGAGQCCAENSQSHHRNANKNEHACLLALLVSFLTARSEGDLQSEYRVKVILTNQAA